MRELLAGAQRLFRAKLIKVCAAPQAAICTFPRNKTFHGPTVGNDKADQPVLALEDKYDDIKKNARQRQGGKISDL